MLWAHEILPPTVLRVHYPTKAYRKMRFLSFLSYSPIHPPFSQLISEIQVVWFWWNLWISENSAGCEHGIKPDIPLIHWQNQKKAIWLLFTHRFKNKLLLTAYFIFWWQMKLWWVWSTFACVCTNFHDARRTVHGRGWGRSANLLSIVHLRLWNHQMHSTSLSGLL